jgi:hypothetical protein
MPNTNDLIKIAALAGGAVLLKSAISYLREYDLRDKTGLNHGRLERARSRHGARICATRFSSRALRAR